MPARCKELPTLGLIILICSFGPRTAGRLLILRCGCILLFAFFGTDDQDAMPAGLQSHNKMRAAIDREQLTYGGIRTHTRKESILSRYSRNSQHDRLLIYLAGSIFDIIATTWFVLVIQYSAVVFSQNQQTQCKVSLSTGRS